MAGTLRLLVWEPPLNTVALEYILDLLFGGCVRKKQNSLIPSIYSLQFQVSRNKTPWIPFHLTSSSPTPFSIDVQISWCGYVVLANPSPLDSEGVSFGLRSSLHITRIGRLLYTRCSTRHVVHTISGALLSPPTGDGALWLRSFYAQGNRLGEVKQQCL